VLAFFVLAPLDPLRFAQIARAYELMPEGFWALLSIIVAFYFGGRMQLKRQDMAVKGGALGFAREVMAMQHAVRERDAAPSPQPAYADAPVRLPQADALVEPAGHTNRVIDAWKSQRALAPQN
jgi:holin (3TMs family)